MRVQFPVEYALLARREAGRDPPIVMSDALAANRRDDDDSLIRCHCLAHGRRQFTDLEAVFPAESHHVITVPGLYIRLCKCSFLGKQRHRGVWENRR